MRNREIPDKSEEGTLLYEDGTAFAYRIVKSDRRTVALQVTKDGQVVVRIPVDLSWKAGHEFVEKKRAWVYAHGKLVKENLEKRESFHFGEGMELLLYGQTRMLHIERDYEVASFRVCDTGKQILLSGPLSQGADLEKEIKDILKQWYRKRARVYLEEKTAWWAERMGVTYERISIRDQETRWGSCSTRGNLNYNWKLILLPEELADYVVVHELAHRSEMNHSKDFWRLVENELPDYQQRKRRLQDYENEINQKY